MVLPAPQSSPAGEGHRGRSLRLWFRGQSLLASDTLLKLTLVPGRAKIRGLSVLCRQVSPALRPPALGAQDERPHKGASNAPADARLAEQWWGRGTRRTGSPRCCACTRCPRAGCAPHRGHDARKPAAGAPESPVGGRLVRPKCDPSTHPAGRAPAAPKLSRAGVGPPPAPSGTAE